MIVLDAAAVVDVVTDQPTKPWVLENLRGQEVLAPAHQLAEVLSAIARLDYLGERVSSSLEEIRVARLNEGELGRIVRTLARRLDARTSPRASFFEPAEREVLA